MVYAPTGRPSTGETRMSQLSEIGATDARENPARGCTRISPGCDRRHATTAAGRFRGGPGHPDEQGGDFRLAPEKPGPGSGQKS
jgi:protein gp37